jgi:7-cyano-7-deazaguanine synthase
MSTNSNSSGKGAVVLLSGGLDSATCLAIAKAEGFELHALTVDYGQRHRRELEQAARVASALGVKSHRTVQLDLRSIGGSALTSDQIDVPKDQLASGASTESSIPVTYVPARNTIFLGLALGLAEVVQARDLFIGANAVDYSGYPDCRPAFLQAFESLAELATVAGVQGAHFHIHAPLLKLTKAEIIKKGISLGVNYGITHSCYDPDEQGRACGHCDSCLLRKRGFQEAGVSDPTVYSP